MATVNASQLSLEKTLEELISEYNDLRTDVSAVTFETLISDSGGTITFEGDTDDDYETTLAVVDPTADRTVSLPNATGTVLTTGNADAGDVTAVSGDLDHVLINDGGVLKRMTLSNILASLPTLTPATADGAALGSATKEWSDLFLADEGVINFGNDQDIALTHAQDTSLAISGAGTTTGLIIDNTATDGDPFLQFALSGTGLFTMGVDDGDSDLFKIGTTAIGTSTALTLTSAGLLTISDDLVIKDGGTIGSATTPEAITIASNGKVSLSGDLQVDGTTTTVNSTTVTVDDPIFTLGGDTASGSDDNKDRGIEFRYNDGSDRIGFFGYDDSESSFTFMTAASNASEVFSGTAGNLLAGNISPAAGDGGTLGTASLEWSDLYLADGGVIYFGNSQDITFTHVADTGLILKHANTGDDKFPTLTLQTGDNDIAISDKLGVINFQAPDETTGTDSILVAAGIEAYSEGDFSTSNNATTLSFKTGASETATEKMKLSSSGVLTLSSAGLVIPDAGNIGSATDTDAIAIASNGQVTFSQTTTTTNLIIADAGNIGSATDTDAIAIAADGKTTFGQQSTFSNGLVVADAGTIGSASDTDAISISSAGVVGFSATTEASATGTAAVTLAGGLGVAKDIWVGDDIVLDSDSAVIKLGDAQEITLTHVTNTGLNLKHTATGDNTPIILTLQTGETDITADEPLGTINFQAPDETGGTDAILVAAAIEAVAEGTFAADNNATKLSFKTGASEAAAEKMSISSVGNVTMKNTAVGDDTPMVLSLLSGETDIAASDVIGKIEWSAPDEGTGTDAILVCGAVDVVSEGDFSATNNATKMSFRLGSSETATEKMQLSSAGALQVDGSLTCTPTSTLLIKDSSGSTLKTVYGVASN